MESESDSEDSSIGEILRRIGCGMYVTAFEAQKIRIEQVEMMTDDDFQKVGISTIGMRLKVKQACRNFLKGNPQSKVVQKYVELSQTTKKKRTRNEKRNLNRNEKSTRRLYIGWKHQTKASGPFKIITASKGGGQRLLDVDKDTSYSELVQMICDCYFPNGYSKWQDLHITDLTYFIGNYTGEPLPSMDGNFTFSKYMSMQSTYPVRLYLHTETLNGTLLMSTADQKSDSNESLASLSDVMGTDMDPTEMTQLSTEATSQCASIQSTSSSENYDYVPANTPTVQLRLARRSLSLSRQRQPTISDRINTNVNTSSESEHQLDVVEVLDSEDEELQRALLESFDPPEINEPDIKTNCDAEIHLNEILKTYQQETVTEDTVTKLLILRSNVLETALKGLDRKAVSLKSRLYIKFSGEIGEDQGGPRREFFRLVMKALQDSKFFEGPETAKIFTHTLTLLENGHYRLVGRLVAMSLAQDGPGLHCLSSDLYDLMVGRRTELREVENILPEHTNLMIQQLRGADKSCKEDSFLEMYGDQLLDMGITNVYQMARNDKETLIEMIKKHHIYYRISGEILQFTSGMNDVNKAWDMITLHADLFKPIFCFKPKEIVGEDMLKLFKVNYSEPGSNNRALEDVSIFGWEMFLQSIEDGDIEVTFSEVLVFVTGADHIPPCGFSKLIDVDFYSCEGRLPSASTCALQLWLPRVTDPDRISSAMFRALKETCGFMKV